MYITSASQLILKRYVKSTIWVMIVVTFACERICFWYNLIFEKSHPPFLEQQLIFHHEVGVEKKLQFCRGLMPTVVHYITYCRVYLVKLIFNIESYPAIEKWWPYNIKASFMKLMWTVYSELVRLYLWTNLKLFLAKGSSMTTSRWGRAPAWTVMRRDASRYWAKFLESTTVSTYKWIR